MITLLLLLLALVQGQTAATDNSDVIILTDKSFADLVTINSEYAWFVDFYAPWCGHCKKMAPIWERLAHETKDLVKIAKIDCTQHPRTCLKYSVHAYPAIKLFRKNRIIAYSGQRTFSAWVQFLDDNKAIGILDQPEPVQEPEPESEDSPTLPPSVESIEKPRAETDRMTDQQRTEAAIARQNARDNKKRNEMLSSSSSPGSKKKTYEELEKELEAANWLIKRLEAALEEKIKSNQ